MDTRTDEQLATVERNRQSPINFILIVDREVFMKTSHSFSSPYDGHYFWQRNFNVGNKYLWEYEIRGLKPEQLDDFREFHEKHMPGFVGLKIPKTSKTS